MTEEETKKQQEGGASGNPQGAEDYIKAITDLKANSVPKDDYDKLKAEKALLVQTLANGGSLPADGQPVKARTIEESRKAFFSPDLSNLEKAKAAIEIREYCIEKGLDDPFLPNGKKIVSEQSDRDAADRVAEVLKSCIENADGDDPSFTSLLQRRLVDAGPIRPRKKQ